MAVDITFSSILGRRFDEICRKWDKTPMEVGPGRRSEKARLILQEAIVCFGESAVLLASEQVREFHEGQKFNGRRSD